MESEQKPKTTQFNCASIPINLIYRLKCHIAQLNRDKEPGEEQATYSGIVQSLLEVYLQQVESNPFSGK